MLLLQLGVFSSVVLDVAVDVAGADAVSDMTSAVVLLSCHSVATIDAASVYV